MAQDLLPPVEWLWIMPIFPNWADIRLIEDAGHLPKYLPAYSPDLNPIEHQ